MMTAATQHSLKTTVTDPAAVPPGYKRSEIGTVPEDWEVRKLGDLGQSLIGLTYEPSNVKQSGLLVLRSSNIGGAGLRYDDNVFVDVEVPERLIVREHDLLICVRNGSRPLIGKCSLIDRRAEGMTFGAFMSVFRSPYNEYVLYCFQAAFIKRQIHDHLGATINQITNKSLNSFSIPFPPPSERQAIAEALSDVDGLLQTLDALIAKKQAIKRATMQQLLTGRTRLPGFSDRWETARLGDVATVRNTKVMPAGVDPDTPCVELEHIGQGDGRLYSQSTARDSTSLKYSFAIGDVLFGRLRPYLRKYWLADRRGICSTEIWPLMVDPGKVCGSFLHAVVQSDQFIEEASISYGTHMPRADWAVMRNFEIRLPALEEQTLIAAALSDMDAEIGALTRRREKASAIKQGMMQQLLTGRIRLAEPTSTMEATA